MCAEERVERDGVRHRDVGERGVRGGEVVALGVEGDEGVSDGEAGGGKREAERDGVQGRAEPEEAEGRGGVEREGDGEVVGGDGQARHEEEQAQRGVRARLGQAADGMVEKRADDGGRGVTVHADEVRVDGGRRRGRVVGGEDAGEVVETWIAVWSGRHGQLTNCSGWGILCTVRFSTCRLGFVSTSALGTTVQ